MNKKDKDFNIISHIMEYCIEIEDTVNFFGDAFERFSSDKIYRNAATMCILQIGELAGRQGNRTAHYRGWGKHLETAVNCVRSRADYRG